jgi:tRNA(adenine34) deaminase
MNDQNSQDVFFMRRALELAQKTSAVNETQAKTCGYQTHNSHSMRAKTPTIQTEVPVGAIIVLNNEIIGEGFNCPISTCDPTAHAEIVALRQAAQKLNNYRLPGVTLYVTLEPCTMCVGAMLHARIERLVFGALDPKTGAVVSAFKLLDEEKLNHKIQYQNGILATECGKILSDFFKELR